MQTETTTSGGAAAIRDGVLFLSGYGISVNVDARHLCVSDGVGRQRRSAKFAKATSRLKRLVVMGQTGFVTLPALKWLNDVGAAFVQLDYDGRALTMSVQGLDNAMIRRAQAFSTVGEARDVLASTLLRPKVEAQAAVLETFALGEPGTVRASLSQIQSVQRFEDILQVERQAALAYWNAWAGVEMRFAQRETVPQHWRSFETRRSPLTSQPRNAAAPINAVLNFLYALLEVEARIALQVRGLDPGLGVFHADAANRQSFATDVMEPVRPHVDAYVLNMLARRVFRARDFVETREGGCRLTSQITRELAGTMPTWAKLMAPYAELVSRQLIALSKSLRVGPIVQRRAQKKSLHKGRLRVRTERVALPNITRGVLPQVRNACRECGTALKETDRKFCAECLPKWYVEHGRQNLGDGDAARAALAKLASAGRDPRDTPAVRKKRAAKASANRRAVVRWRDDGSLKGVNFNRDILPKLQALPLSRISKTLGCSDSYSSKIRRGLFTPHKRHWQALRELTARAPR